MFSQRVGSCDSGSRRAAQPPSFCSDAGVDFGSSVSPCTIFSGLRDFVLGLLGAILWVETGCESSRLFSEACGAFSESSERDRTAIRPVGDNIRQKLISLISPTVGGQSKPKGQNAVQDT